MIKFHNTFKTPDILGQKSLLGKIVFVKTEIAVLLGALLLSRIQFSVWNGKFCDICLDNISAENHVTVFDKNYEKCERVLMEVLT